MTKEFDAYCNSVMADLSKLPTNVVADDPKDLVTPAIDPSVSTANTPTKVVADSEADAHANLDGKPESKAAPASAGKDDSGLVKTSVKAGQPIDKEEFAKDKKAESGAEVKGKATPAEVKTDYKAGQLVAKPTAPTNK